jgi:hypothetical protein
MSPDPLCVCEFNITKNLESLLICLYCITNHWTMDLKSILFFFLPRLDQLLTVPIPSPSLMIVGNPPPPIQPSLPCTWRVYPLCNEENQQLDG